jgi:hypothetical protein
MSQVGIFLTEMARCTTADVGAASASTLVSDLGPEGPPTIVNYSYSRQATPSWNQVWS